MWLFLPLEPSQTSIRYITSKSSRLIRIHSFVRGISFLEAMDLDRFETIVSLHPNVKFFRFVAPLPSGAENLSVPSLTHLVAFTNWGEQAPLSGTLYTNLTHLDIRRYETEVIPSLSEDLSQIRSLTAVSISGGRFEEFKYDAVLAAIFSLPTTLDLIAIWTLHWNEQKYSDMDVGTKRLVTGELDARVVVVNWGADARSAPNCVTMEHSPEISLWDCFGSLEMEIWVRAATYQAERKACTERRSPSP
ncbi:hypothetical protein DL96DRAFT_1628594 [Flagelloscypha sp. PMI_526]|nr:hypothetical protein DL96DRAFT_1628594 [Flagelloscypha sp. PMI_526]